MVVGEDGSALLGAFNDNSCAVIEGKLQAYGSSDAWCKGRVYGAASIDKFHIILTDDVLQRRALLRP